MTKQTIHIKGSTVIDLRPTKPWWRRLLDLFKPRQQIKFDVAPTLIYREKDLKIPTGKDAEY